MTAALSPVTESRLAHYGASPEHASDLLEPRDAQRLELYLSELACVASDMPASVSDNATLHAVNDVLARATTARRGLEDLRKDRLKTVLAEQRCINDLFRPLDDALATIIDGGKRLVVSWTAAERERVRRETEEAERKARLAAEAQAKAAEAAERARTEAGRQKALAASVAAGQAVEQALAEIPREPLRGVRSEEGTTSTREEWDFEIVDAALLPREYLVPDERKLRAAVQRMGVREILGCNIFPRVTVAVRPR